MTYQEKFRVAYSKTRQALHWANFEGEMSIAFHGSDFFAQADASEYGARVDIVTSEPIITQAVIKTIETLYAETPNSVWEREGLK